MFAFWALISAFFYGAGDFCGGLATRRGQLLSVVATSQAVGLVGLLVLTPLQSAGPPTRLGLLWGAAAGVAGSGGVALLYYGLAIGTVSVVAPISATCALALPVAAGLWLGERPSRVALVGVAVAALAIVLISAEGTGSKPVERRTSAVMIALLSGLLIGVFLICLGRTGPSAGLWPLLAARVVSVPAFCIASLLYHGRIVPSRAALGMTVWCGIFDQAANALYLIATRSGPLSIVAPLNALYPASTVLLARWVLRERLRRHQRWGLVFAVIAALLITWHG